MIGMIAVTGEEDQRVVFGLPVFLNLAPDE